MVPASSWRAETLLAYVGFFLDKRGVEAKLLARYDLNNFNRIGFRKLRSNSATWLPDWVEDRVSTL